MSGSWLNALPRLAMRVAVRMYREVISDQIGLLAAGIAFYALLAIFPAMASVLAILGIFFSATEITGPVETATAAIPPSAASLIREQASSIVASDHSALGVTAAVGLIAALYATARGMRHLIQGLNVAFNETETRGLIMRWLAIILLAVFVIGGALMGMAAIAVIPVLLALFPEEVQAQSIVSVIRWVALFSISTAGIAVIYRFGPDRQHRSWHWTLPGAVVACLLWVIASAGFSLYAENFASYQRSFGALTGVIVLLTWLWLSTYVLLLGAELNAALEAVFHGERKRRAGATEGAPAESVPRD
ncbi:YihY/virulence factor BrkB family protein [Pararhodobacter sp.]|uniref:YihY/virulence factor BrkB family protein n=1 Tax=Pararhodobacter sp. TaxID=2127056 RepID=UPI002AFED880|nr:YihY/virulence factor BrkB family protein [Pararhodobacter sp.]